MVGDRCGSWLESSVEHLLTRDVEQVDGGRDPARLRRYVEAYALSAAGVVDERTLYEAAGIDRQTALAYERVVESLLTVDVTPAWTSNGLQRLVRSPKRYVVDPALVGAILRLDTNAVLKNGDLLGQPLDTFVASQLRAELGVSASRPRLHLVRQHQGCFDIDPPAEVSGGRVIAIEVKADSAPTSDSARHVGFLRDRVGEAFVAGIVFDTGSRVYSLADRIVAVPISALWAWAKRSERFPREPLRCCPGEGAIRRNECLLPRHKGIYHVGCTDYPDPTYP